MKTLFCALALLLASFSCAPRQNLPTSNSASYKELMLTFRSSRSWVVVGEPVQFEFVVNNTLSVPRVFASANTPVLDLVVKDTSRDEVLLTWSAQNPDKVQHRVEWKPGESKVLHLTWIPRPEQLGRFVNIGGVLMADTGVHTGAGVTLCVGDSDQSCFY